MGHLGAIEPPAELTVRHRHGRTVEDRVLSCLSKSWAINDGCFWSNYNSKGDSRLSWYHIYLVAMAGHVRNSINSHTLVVS